LKIFNYSKQTKALENPVILMTLEYN